MRCPDCNKFVSLDLAEVEVSDLEVSEDGTVTATARISRTCAECGQELKSAELELETQVDVGKHGADGEGDHEGHELSVEDTDTDAIEEGGGRYKKSYFGVKVSFTVTCSCDPNWSIDGEMEDKVPASSMEEMV
jgi:hypothetical protein